MQRIFLLLVAAFGCVMATVITVAIAQQPASAPTTAISSADSERLRALGSRGARVHDPSTIIKQGDEYFVFYTGRGVPSWRSKDLVNWTAGPRGVPNAPAWVAQAVPGNRGNNFWAPDVIKVDDKYFLYYSVSTFGQNTSAIGLASNTTLNPDDPAYAWVDQGIIVQSSRGDRFNAIDPAAVRDREGGLWLAFGSFWSGIKLIQLDPKTGQRIAPDSLMHSLAYAREIEAASIYAHGDYYYLLLNWGICCRGADSTYNMRVGRSKQITGPYLDKSGKDMMQEGGSMLLETDGPFIGPGHPSILKDGENEWMSMHYYSRGTRGATLALRKIHWDADGWPVVE